MSSNTLRGLGRNGQDRGRDRQEQSPGKSQDKVEDKVEGKVDDKSKDRVDHSDDQGPRADSAPADGGGKVQRAARSSDEEPTAPALALPKPAGDTGQTAKVAVNEQAVHEMAVAEKAIADAAATAPNPGLSLDAPVPGAGSLDGSVPDAKPSLDSKTPSLAVTLIGIPPPSLVKKLAARDQGTMQGRDVHLPADMQRFASMRQVANPPPAAGGEPTSSTQGQAQARVDDPRADAFERPGEKPGRIDPARTVRIASPLAEGAYIHGHAPEQVDVSSHSPWYEQEPRGDDAYDDPAPNLLGRVAIGAAVAAALAVVLFAFVRLHGQGVAEEETDVKPLPVPVPIVTHEAPAPMGATADPAMLPTMPTSGALPGDLPVRQPALGESDSPSSDSPSSGSPSSGSPSSGSPSSGSPSGVGAAAAPPDVAPPRRLEPFPEIRSGVPSLGQTAAAAQAKRRPVPGAPPLGGPRSGPTTPPPNASRPPTFSGSGPLTPSPVAAAPKPEPGEPMTPAPASNASRAPGPDKPRGKPNYDPDSTLPLNLE